jgi:N-formylglutamate deformylase
MTNPFFIKEALGRKTPVILSVPHSGVEFPVELKGRYRPEMAARPDDTDWFVHDLYDFAPALGITVIHARYSRWVVDLNRDPQSAPLYDDGRIITGLTPSTDFFGGEIYTDPTFVPDRAETERRVEEYYRPYHRTIERLLAERIAEFGAALLWDAHSIRRLVPTIRPEPFPDLILGDNEGRTAGPGLIQIALGGLGAGKYEVSHKHPFKGGYITRSFGRPESGVHALQLEMAKVHYMDDETSFNETKAGEVRKVLVPVFENLIAQLTK